MGNCGAVHRRGTYRRRVFRILEGIYGGRCLRGRVYLFVYEHIINSSTKYIIRKNIYIKLLTSFVFGAILYPTNENDHTKGA